MPNHEILYGRFGKPFHQKRISDDSDDIDDLDNNDELNPDDSDDL
ncbi:MAG: hypothetical protein AABX29_04235 [Nanoarchaeota archaeon]